MGGFAENIPDGWAPTNPGPAPWISATGGDGISWDFTHPIAADGSFNFSSSLGVDAYVEADPTTDSNRVSVQAGTPILVSGTVEADSNSVGANVSLSVIWEDSTRTVLSESSVFLSHVTTANTLERKSGVVTAPANACFYRLKFGKVDGAFTAWWNDFHDSVFPVSFFAHRSADVSITSGNAIIADSEDYDYGLQYDNTTGLYTARSTMIHDFAAGIYTTALLAGEYAHVRIINVTTGLFVEGAAIHAHANSDIVIVQAVTGPWLVHGGDQVGAYLYHNHAGTLTIKGNANNAYSFFSGAER